MTVENALVTGASSGIGAAFARALVARGHKVLLVARREERLAALQRELGGEAVAGFVALDLAETDAARRLQETLAARGLGVDLLVNNAGLGIGGPFSESSETDTAQLIHVNVRAAVALARTFLPAMVERRAGAVINVVSMSAFQPVPFLACYAASKSFLLSFSESLAEELRGTGVQVQALCPGLVQTEFQARAGTDRVAFNRTRPQSPEFVVEASLRALGSGRVIVIPGWRDRAMVQLQRFLPRVLVRRAAAELFRPPPA